MKFPSTGFEELFQFNSVFHLETKQHITYSTLFLNQMTRIKIFKLFFLKKISEESAAENKAMFILGTTLFPNPVRTPWQS